MAKITLFELKEKMATMQAAIAADAEWISEKAADPSVPMDEINAKKTHRDELVSRYEMLKAEHDEMEAQQRAAVEQKAAAEPKNDRERGIMAKAAFYRAVLTGGDVRKAYEGLGALPSGTADLGKGENLLPTNMSSELLLEPLEENSLRRIEPASQITGLEEVCHRRMQPSFSNRRRAKCFRIISTE